MSDLQTVKVFRDGMVRAMLKRNLEPTAENIEIERKAEDLYLKAEEDKRQKDNDSDGRA